MSLTTGKIKPLFLSGTIYFGAVFETDPETGEEADTFRYSSNLQLGRCTLIPNGDNERLIFDIIPGPGLWDRHFAAFLYKDGTLLGKIKFTRDAGVTDDIVSGEYKRTDEGELIIRGIMDDTQGAKTGFYIELEVAASQPSI
jgi:hypothetical protein